jgi:hypothetical protein
MGKVYSINEHARLIANSFRNDRELAFTGDAVALKEYQELYGSDDFNARHVMFLDRCLVLAEIEAARREHEMLANTSTQLGLPAYWDTNAVHPVTLARELAGRRQKQRPIKIHQTSMKVRRETNITPDMRLEFKLHTAARGDKLAKLSKSHIFGMVVAKQINELIAGTKDQQELRAVARLLIKYFHPKLIKELLQQFGLDIPTNLMQKIINSKSMLSDDHNSDSQDKHELMELSTLVQSHINDISIGLHFDLKEALAQDFREAFANKISRSFAHSLFAELNITETMPTRISLKPELKLLSDCFYKQRLTPLIERNIVLLRKELDNQIYKASTKPFERDLYAHALKSMVA